MATWMRCVRCWSTWGSATPRTQRSRQRSGCGRRTDVGCRSGGGSRQRSGRSSKRRRSGPHRGLQVTADSMLHGLQVGGLHRRIDFSAARLSWSSDPSPRPTGGCRRGVCHARRRGHGHRLTAGQATQAHGPRGAADVECATPAAEAADSSRLVSGTGDILPVRVTASCIMMCLALVALFKVRLCIRHT